MFSKKKIVTSIYCPIWVGDAGVWGYDVFIETHTLHADLRVSIGEITICYSDKTAYMYHIQQNQENKTCIFRVVVCVDFIQQRLRFKVNRRKLFAKIDFINFV